MLRFYGAPTMNTGRTGVRDLYHVMDLAEAHFRAYEGALAIPGCVNRLIWAPGGAIASLRKSSGPTSGSVVMRLRFRQRPRPVPVMWRHAMADLRRLAP